MSEIKECTHCGSYYDTDEYDYCPYCNIKEREQ